MPYMWAAITGIALIYLLDLVVGRSAAVILLAVLLGWWLLALALRSMGRTRRR